jgi:hypothetical protein
VEVHLVLEPRPVHVEPGLEVLARCRYPAPVFGGVAVFESRMPKGPFLFPGLSGGRREGGG